MEPSVSNAVHFSRSSASVLLDLVRGTAALLVLLAHWKIMFFVDYPQISEPRFAFALPYVLGDAGHQAVIIFFVLSGYLISGVVFRALHRDEWRWSLYLLQRFTRLWVVLLPALLLGACWDLIGLHWSRTPALYSGISLKSHHIAVSQTFTMTALAGNIAFLQTVVVPVFGSNGALWSLANEFWYYILFPLVWLALRGKLSPFWRAVHLVLFCALAWWTRTSLLPLFPVWLGGVALHALPKLRCGRLARSAVSAFYIPAVFLFAKARFGFSTLANDYLFGFLTMSFVWVMLSARDLEARGWYVQPVRRFASFSFSLYALHMPALLLLTALVAGSRLWSPMNLRRDMVAFTVLGLLIAYSYGVASATEFHTDRVRRWIGRGLGIQDGLRT